MLLLVLAGTLILPQIRIQYGYFLDNALNRNESATALSEYELNQKAETYTKAWGEFEKQILEEMMSLLNLEFNQNIVDVFVVNRVNGSFSNPMVITAKYSPDEFVDALAHELVHRLLTDNTRRVNPYEYLRKKYPNETVIVANHILVHAIMRYLYIDVLRAPERLARDIDKSQKYPSYRRAWEIVGAEGYKKIISSFRKTY